MKKRNRRTLNEIRSIRQQLLTTVGQHGRLTLSQLVGEHGESIGVRNTPSDKNLVKKQLDRLAKSGRIDFVKVGRDLVAKAQREESASSEIRTGESFPATATSGNGQRGTDSDLAVIRAYAIQLEEFAKTLQGQIRTLVRMVEKAAH